MAPPEASIFFGFIGCAAALVFTSLGAAYGTAKSGVGIASMGVMRPELVMKSIIPVVMAGVIGIYGLIIAVIISGRIGNEYDSFKGFADLGAGLCVGLSGLAAGMAIGIVGDAGVRATAQQPSASRPRSGDGAHVHETVQPPLCQEGDEDPHGWSRRGW